MVMENREDEECLSLTSVGVDFHGKNDEKKVLTDPGVCLGRTCSRSVYKKSCFVSSSQDHSLRLIGYVDLVWLAYMVYTSP